MSDYHSHKAWLAGRDAALAQRPKSSCRRTRGTIYYDDWHDGYGTIAERWTDAITERVNGERP